MNKYEYTRSIRFLLKGDIEKFQIDDVVDEEDMRKQFLKEYKLLINAFEKTVFTENGDDIVCSRLEMNYKWIRSYARDQYNMIENRSEKHYSVRSAPFLRDIFVEWRDRNDILLKELGEIINREEEDQAKRSDLAFLLRQFISHDYFSFVKEFAYYAKDLNTSSNLNTLREEIDTIEITTKKIVQNTSPDQSNGLEVVRGSFNYYTINKVSKNIDGDIDEKKKQLERSVRVDTQLLKDVDFDKYIIDSGYRNVGDLSLQEMYDLMKEYKSIQKSAFLEGLKEERWKRYTKIEEKGLKKNGENGSDVDMDALKGQTFSGLDALAESAGIEQDNRSATSYVSEQENAELFIEWVTNKYPLFRIKEKDSTENAIKFLKITEQIQELGVEKNQYIQSKNYVEGTRIDKEIRDLKMKRGKNFFQGNFVFETYFKFCNEYKKIAMNRGRVFAQIRSLEQEKIEARLLKYWVHIIQRGAERSLLLIPKTADNLRNAKKYLDSLKNNHGEMTFYDMNSLTLRALDKLVRKNVGKDVEALNDENELKAIAIYKKALRGEYPEIQLDLTGFKDGVRAVVECDDYKDKEDFRMALESVSYYLGKKYLTKENIEELKRKFDAMILQISSYDLERNISNKKEHTVLWDEFWDETNVKDYFSVRINPEVRVFYRKAQKKLPIEKSSNRFSKEQLTVAFTLTQNAAQKRIETAFEENDRLTAITRQFNEDVITPFVEEKGEHLYYFGIDRGNQELASLCITQFSREKYEAMLLDGTKKELDIPIFPKIVTYKIKDDNLYTKKDIVIDKKGNKKEITLIDNPSYFTDDDVFEEVNAPFIDLTVAKLIKGKIILNGDVKTYLSLKEENAKRKLFDVYSQIDGEGIVEYCASDKHRAWNIKSKKGYFMRNAFVIKFKESERNNYQLLCYYPDKLATYRSKESMQKILQDYLDDLRGDHKMETITIDRINNLRDAITSNMVGIIAHLFEQYPGIINLENLHSKNDIDRHFRDNNENIARRLEWSLYKKFQKIGFVPPQLRQTVFMRENEKVNQFGIIHFVPKEATSTNCPYCAEKANKKRDTYESLKFTEHALNCEKCGFDSRAPKKPLELVGNSDDVASYNIAKNTRKEAE